MNEFQVLYEILPNKRIRVYDVPVGEDNLITVEMRSVTLRDAPILQDPDLDVAQKTYTLLAAIITKWGDREGITTLELAQEQHDEAVMMLDQVAQKFCIRQYRFVSRKQDFTSNNLRPKSAVVH
jgi:hypothetical protein